MRDEIVGFTKPLSLPTKEQPFEVSVAVTGVTVSVGTTAGTDNLFVFHSKDSTQGCTRSSVPSKAIAPTLTVNKGASKLPPFLASITVADLDVSDEVFGSTDPPRFLLRYDPSKV